MNLRRLPEWLKNIRPPSLPAVCTVTGLALVVTRGDWQSAVTLLMSLTALEARRWRSGDPALREELTQLQAKVARVLNRG